MVCDKKDIINVLIGYDAELSLSLERSGAETHIFDERHLLFARMSSNATFHRASFEYGDILSMRLRELARRKGDKLLFLYASEKYRALLRDVAPSVECDYIIPDKDLL